MNNSLKRQIFDMWMSENHPYFYPIYGVLTILLILGFLGSILLVVFDIDWWWKSTLIFGVGLILTKLVTTVIISTYVDEFNANK